MKAQVIRTLWTRIDGDNRKTFRRGQIIDVSKAELERGIETGSLRPESESSKPLPPANHGFQGPALTQPDGEAIENADVGDAGNDFRAPKSHAEADAMADELDVTFPAKTKLDDKVEALRQVHAAKVANEASGPQATDEDLSELSDEELIQRAVDFGHSEDEVADKSHDELVLFVAEAMARHTPTAQAQAERVDEASQE